MNRCRQCPYKLYPLLIDDCPKIHIHVTVRYMVEAYEDNQTCIASCPGQSKGQEMTTRKFFKVPEIYWRQRYLRELGHEIL